MPVGIQCFDAQGRLILDITERLTRVIGSINTGTSNGSVTLPDIGFNYWIFVRAASASYYFPNVSISGRTISWNFSPGVGTYWVPQAATVVYGIM